MTILLVVLWDTERCFPLPCINSMKKSVNRKTSESRGNDFLQTLGKTFLLLIWFSSTGISQMAIEFNSLMRLPERQQAWIMAVWPRSKSFLIKKFQSAVGFLPRTWSSLGIWQSFGSHAWTVVLPVLMAKAREMEKLTFWKVETFLRMQFFSPVNLKSIWTYLRVKFCSLFLRKFRILHLIYFLACVIYLMPFILIPLLKINLILFLLFQNQEWEKDHFHRVHSVMGSLLLKAWYFTGSSPDPQI